MLRIRRALLSLAVLVLLVPFHAAADVAEELDRLFSETYAASEPGAAVIAVRGGATVFRKAYGMADLEHAIPLQPDMVFRLGSITKQFTAVAVLMLEEEGKLKVSDDITKYLPGYPTHGKTVTVEHLLTHTSGIPSYTEIPGWMSTKIRQDLSVQEMIDGWKDLDLEFEPGTQWRYDNSGYFMLGAIVEAASGMSYADFVEERIFKPLGMTSSYYGSHSRIIPKRARGYEPGDGGGFVNAPFLDMDQPYAAGSLVSTVDDLAKWDASLYTDKLLSAEARERAWTSHKLADGKETGYGYGWAVGEHNGKKVLHHSGGIFGFRTDAIRIPDEKIYVAVLSNGSPANPSLMAERAVRVLLGETVEPSRVAVDAKDLERFVGVYRIDESTTRAVTLQDGQLYSQRTGGGKLAMHPMGDDTFFYEEVSSLARFVSEGGKVTHMEMHRFAQPVETAALTDEPPPEEPVVAEVDPAVYETYRGSYELMPGFVLKVWPEEGKLMTQATGQGSIEIFPESETVFFNSSIGARITFVREDDGSVRRLVLEQGGQTLEAKRLDD